MIGKTRLGSYPVQAAAYLQNNCAGKHRNGDIVYGMDAEEIPLQQHLLNDGTTATEYLQRQIMLEDGGTVLILGLRLDASGFKFEWTDEEIKDSLDDMREHEAEVAQLAVEIRKNKLNIVDKMLASIDNLTGLIKELDGPPLPAAILRVPIESLRDMYKTAPEEMFLKMAEHQIDAEDDEEILEEEDDGPTEEIDLSQGEASPIDIQIPRSREEAVQALDSIFNRILGARRRPPEAAPEAKAPEAAVVN